MSACSWSNRFWTCDFGSPGRKRQMLSGLLLAGVSLCGLASAAELRQRHVMPTSEQQQAPHAAGAANAADALAQRLFPLQANLVQVFPVIDTNADGSDLWPCIGRATGNPDCPVVGNPSITLPRGGIVLGFPSFTWSLAAGPAAVNGVGCDALSNGTTGAQPTQYRPCAQLDTWFEDNSNDPTDDLLQRITVTQGSRVIYDSGTVDYGPAGPITYPVRVLLNTDVNFGFWPGAAVGPNNGNCVANVGYPLSAPTNPGTTYVVAAGQTCEQPVAGKVRIVTVTMLATPTYAQASGDVCSSSGVASPCFTVTWTKRDEIHQDFDAFFQ